MSERPREWDAPTYDRIAEPQTRWGARVVEWLDLRGDERVLDAGCGTGRVTELLLDGWADVSVIALDASSEMLAEARRRLARFRDRVTFVHADLAEPLPIDGRVDAVLSTATFHWVRDHDALFGNLATVMRPGAQLAAQSGAPGNVESVMDALRRLGTPSDIVFPTPQETRERLERAGFVDVETWTHPDAAEFATDEEFRSFLETVVLREQIASTAPADVPGFLERVLELIPPRRLDYVRLNMRAVRRPS